MSASTQLSTAKITGGRLNPGRHFKELMDCVSYSITWCTVLMSVVVPSLSCAQQVLRAVRWRVMPSASVLCVALRRSNKRRMREGKEETMYDEERREDRDDSTQHNRRVRFTCNVKILVISNFALEKRTLSYALHCEADGCFQTKPVTLHIAGDLYLEFLLSLFLRNYTSRNVYHSSRPNS